MASRRRGRRRVDRAKPPVTITLQVFVDAIESSLGNITHAAEALGITKGHALRLTRKWGLNARARDLRARVGAPARGRPSGS